MKIYRNGHYYNNFKRLMNIWVVLDLVLDLLILEIDLTCRFFS